jgi:hypothetical protein
MGYCLLTNYDLWCIIHTSEANTTRKAKTMKTFNVTYTFSNGDTFTLEFRGRDRGAVYSKAAAHAREYYNEQPWNIEITQKAK